MVSEILDYKMKRQMATIDQLVSELVVIRKYICSARAGLTYCRRHLNLGTGSFPQAGQVGSDFEKSQELLMLGLREAEKRVKKQLAEANRELRCVCRHQRGR